MGDEEKPTIGTAEAAEIFGCDKTTISRWCREKKFPSSYQKSPRSSMAHPRVGYKHAEREKRKNEWRKEKMKRVACIILVLMLFFDCNALAAGEIFSVRNGIHMGMSKSEVIQIEAQNGEKNYSDGPIGLDFNNIDIAGYSGGHLIYYFGQDDSLHEISYSWSKIWRQGSEYNTLSKSDASNVYKSLQNQYDVLLKALSDKYEKIGGLSGRNEAQYVEFEGSSYYPFTSSRLSKHNIYGFTQFLAPDGDNYVEIIIKCYWYEEDGSGGSMLIRPTPCIELVVSIQYNRITKEQMEETIQKSNDMQKKMNNDL